MAKNNLSKKGPVARLVIGATMVATAATYAVLSPVLFFTPFLTVALPIVAGLSILGITLGSFAISKLHKISKAGLSVNEANKTKEVVIEKEPAEVGVKLPEKRVETIKKPTMEVYRTDKTQDKNMFIVYNVDGKTIKKDVNNNKMQYKITGDEYYERALMNYLRPYVMSKESGDCIVEVKNENGEVLQFNVHGEKYASEFPRKEILAISSKLRVSEMEQVHVM